MDSRLIEKTTEMQQIKLGIYTSGTNFHKLKKINWDLSIEVFG